MYVRCQKCDSFFEIKENRIGPQGRKVRCAFCRNTFLLPRRDPSSDESADAGLTSNEAELTMLLSLWNKPTVPQQELRAKFQPEQVVGKFDQHGVLKESLSPLAVTKIELDGLEDELVSIHGEFIRLLATRECKARMLKQSGWFGSLPSPNDLMDLASPWELIHAKPGVDFIRPGYDIRYLAVIVKGMVRVFRPPSHPAGHEELATTLGAGDSFGETTLFHEGVHQQHITALTKTTTMMLSDRAYWHLGETHPSAFIQLTMELANHMAHRLIRAAGGSLV